MKRTAQAGVALISVLLVLSLATLVVVGMSTERQQDIRITENQLRNDQAWLYVQSLEAAARQQLANETEPAISTSFAFEGEAGVMLEATLEDLQSRLNLNNLMVNGELSDLDVLRLKRLLRNLKLKEDLADAIIDWMDVDGQVQSAQGAEDEWYTALLPPYRAANRFFADVSELRLVRGIGEAEYRALLPHVVAIDGYAPLNVNTASAALLRCLADEISRDRSESMYRASGKPFRELKAFLNDEAVTGSGISQYGLSVTSRYFRLQGSIVMPRVRLRFQSYLMRQKDGRVTVLRRARQGWMHG